MLRKFNSTCAAFILLIAISTTVGASDWRREDTLREAVYQSIALVDWAQTRVISRSPEHHERNKILGRNPSAARINKYFLVTGVAHAAASSLIPIKYRSGWQWASILFEAGHVVHNRNIGIRIKF